MSNAHMDGPAIDIHGHIGQVKGSIGLQAQMTYAPVAHVSQRAKACAVERTLVSDLGAFSVSNEPTDVEAANQRAQQAAHDYDNLQFYAVLNPRMSGWEDHIAQLLTDPHCAGVKLHGRWNHWRLEDYGQQVFEFLNEHKALTLAHTGDPGTEPEHYIPLANHYEHVRLIIAHLGNDNVDDTRDRQIKAVGKAIHKNVWIDTSSARSILSGLLEYAVEQLGAERLLFGSDTPLYSLAAQKSRIAYAEISDEAKQRILFKNAFEILSPNSA